MIVIVCYDVKTEDKAGRRRLRKVAEACKDYGTRVQYSVFECPIDEPRWVKLRARILDIVELGEDSVRFYFIDDGAARRTEHHGVRKPLELKDPLVI